MGTTAVVGQSRCVSHFGGCEVLNIRTGAITLPYKIETPLMGQRVFPIGRLGLREKPSHSKTVRLIMSAGIPRNRIFASTL